jgi:serine/threonine protein phosphatase PrpC
VGWDAGIVRRHKPNEDSMVVLQATCTYQGQLVPFGLFVIADGMGGHECGQEASRLAVQNMMHTVLQNIVMGRDLSDEFLADMLIGGVEWANLAIYHRDQIENKDMGTTLTAALVVGTKAYIVNVGDSRTYLFRESSGLQQITHDHSLVASMVARGEIRPEEIYTHPERSKVYRCLGYSDELKVDSFTIDLRAYDRLLLCSDGLWEMVRDPDIENIVASSSPHASQISSMLIQAALTRGGADNVSVVAVCVLPAE